MQSNLYFFFNGQTYYTKKVITLFDVIRYFNYIDYPVALEYNNRICIKNKWHNIIIKNNDKIEIITIVGGG